MTTTSSCNYVRGTVVDEASHGGVAGAAVSLVLVRNRKRTVIGNTKTGTDGTFLFDVRAATGVERVVGSGRCELEVSRDGTELTITGGTWRWFLGVDPGVVQLCVAVREGCEPAQPGVPEGVTGNVIGRVVHHDGTPVQGATVRLYEFNLDGESDVLATTTTGTGASAGWYSFPYTYTSPPIKHLLVKVVSAALNGKLLALSPPQFGKPLPLRIDVETCNEEYRSPTEWNRYDGPLESQRGTTAYAALGATQAVCLHGATGVPLQRIEWWKNAHLLHLRLYAPGLSPEIAEALYGTQYSGLPADLDLLYMRGQARIDAALARAWRDNIIGTSASNAGPTLYARLGAWRFDQLSDPANPYSLEALFSLSTILSTGSTGEVTALVNFYAGYTGAPSAFWGAVESTLWPTNTTAVAEALRLVTLAGVAYSHVPTVAAILGVLGTGPAAAVATYGLSAWEGITAAISDLPAGIPGVTLGDQQHTYAHMLMENALAAWPALALSDSLQHTTDPTLTTLKTFATAHPSFDFDRSDVLSATGSWSAADVTTKIEVAAFQRAFRIAPTSSPYTSATQIYKAGIRSAYSATRMGSTRAIAKLTAQGMSDADARLTVARAGQVSAKTAALFTMGHQNLSGVRLSNGSDPWLELKGIYARFLPGGNVDTSAFPSWDSLFGSVDYCTCQDCKSITGPAAYLVDLLHWLDEREGWEGAGGLKAGRGDLGHLLLNCNNTNRVLPYIDLALEIMENAAAGILTVGETSPYTTDAEGAELLAAPQFVNHAVYDELTDLVYPITLPFHRALTEGRAFLEHLGVSRADLMRAFQNSVGAPSPSSIAYEELGLFASAADAITVAGTTNYEYDRWGIDPGDWPDGLRVVDTFLDRAEMSYDDLLDLLHTRYVNGRSLPTDVGNVTLSFADACDLDSYTLELGSGTWETTFGRIRQLVRLRRATGWSFLELDKVLNTLAVSTVSPTTLESLGYIARICKEKNLSPVEVAAWLAPIDPWDDRDTRTDPVPSLHESVFLNPSLFPINDRAVLTSTAWNFVLDASLELNGAGLAISGFTIEIQALLGIDAATWELLTPELGSSPTLTRANLSTLYRWTSLSRVLRLSVKDTLALAHLWGSSPFTAAGAWTFIENVEHLLESGLSVDDVLHLVEHDEDATARVAPSDSWFQDVLGRLGDKLAAHFQETTTPSSDPDRSQLTGYLDEILVGSAVVTHPTVPSLTVDRTMLDGAIDGTLADDSFTFSVSYATYLRLVLEAPLTGHCDIDQLTEELATLSAPLSSPADATQMQARQLTGLQRLARGRDALAALETPGSDPGQSQLASMLDDILPSGATVSHPTNLSATNITRTMLDGAIAGTLTTSALPPGMAGMAYNTCLRLLLEAVLEGHADTHDFATRLAAAWEPLSSTDDANEVTARQLWAVQRLVQWRTAEGLVVTHFGEALSLPESDLEALRNHTFDRLSADMETPSGTFTDWVDLYLHADFRAGGFRADGTDEITSASCPDALPMAQILAKLSLVVSRLGLDEDEFAFWVAAGSAATPTWMLWNPFTFLETAPTSTTSAYAGLVELGEMARLRARIPGTEPSFAELLNAVDPWDTTASDAFCSSLADRTGWNVDDLTGVVDAIDLTTTTSGTRLEILHQFLDATGIVRRVGVSPDVVKDWGGEITATESSEIVMAARSRYETSAAWAKVARPLRDRLRKQQRDALVAYLVTRWGGAVADADDLYGELLIDTQMNPEMLTSRIKQAACSVQLFIQRNMVGIDDAVSFNEEDHDEWEWMKNYRVWEAARKVFLYPENWIEPELRDDKTAFFLSLENELSQGDLTDERAEDAALAYLDRLDQVAHPQVLGYFVQREAIDDGGGAEETIDLLHVFARSRGQTPVYWYRRWEDQATWTPWEKVDCGVEGTMLVPVVFERRLMLFWFTLDDTGADDEDADPQKWYQIRLSWSEYRDGKWQPKNEADEALSLESTWAGSAVTEDGTRRASDYGKTRFTFVSSESDDGTLVLTGMCWNAGLDRWYKIGAFTVDPCTRRITADELENEEVAALDETQLEYAEEYWTSLNHDERDEMLGVHPEWIDLPSALQTAVYGIVLPQYLEDLETATGDVVPVHRLQREDENFFSPGFDGVEDGGDHLTIWLADVDDHLVYQLGTEGTQVTLLDSLGESCVVLPTQFNDFVSQVPFFVDTGKRTYFVVRETESTVTTAQTTANALTTLDRVVARSVDGDCLGGQEDSLPVSRRADSTGLYRFDNFFHPYTCTFIKEARREGLGKLLAPSELGSAAELSRQQLEGDVNEFQSTFKPTSDVKTPYPWDTVDFERTGAYSAYNWELFFHLPFYVANRLTDNQRFEDALRWYSYIFDPLARAEPTSAWSAAPGRFWKVKPFLDPVSAPVADWIAFTGADGDSDAADSFERQVEEWREDPFNPHLLARLRPGTYQKAVVMKYIENLIAWGDNLFTRDTIESINEATQYYILAKQILGDRPEALTKPTAVTDQSFDDLQSVALDAFSNLTVTVTAPTIWLEGLMRSGRWDPLATSGKIGSFRLRGQTRLPSVGGDTYFCIPPNPKLLGYWDKVDDRLFKIRNSLNIEGVFRSLPLYEPPIDPALLVRASALGVDLGTVLADLDTPLPNHRFTVMIQRAQALVGSVKALGGALLSALEKRDAEALALLRQSHESTVLNLVRESKEKAIEEAKENVAAARQNKRTVEVRREYYKGLQERGWLSEETLSALLQQQAAGFETLAGTVNALSGILGALPDLSIGVCTGSETGGQAFARVMGGIASASGAMAAYTRGQSGYLSTVASYKRRAQEWKNQERLAQKELVQIDHQIAAGDVRLAIAKQDLKAHQQQIEQANEIRSWMESKFTNQQLYDWMVSQVSATYYQSYQLAYKVAKRAQKSYNHELGRAESFLSGAYWDNTRKGLLAGEQLGFDLERMDAAYLENDRREYEITRRISLSLFDPVAIAMLQSTGMCDFSLPEALFDLDFPGHYMRRIQAVAVSIPCVGSGTSTVNGRLTLTASATRQEASRGAASQPADDGGTVESIAFSTGTEDTGLFQLDLHDPKYLPFERRGVISSWSLKLTDAIAQFDRSSITDVVLTVRYTARDGGDAEASEVTDGFATTLNSMAVTYGTIAGSDPDTAGFVRCLSARRDFPDEWYEATNPASGTDAILTIELLPEHLPYFARGATEVNVAGVAIVIPNVGLSTYSLTVDGTPFSADLYTMSSASALMWGGATVSEITGASVTITITLTGVASALAEDDVLVLIAYAVSG